MRFFLKTYLVVLILFLCACNPQTSQTQNAKDLTLLPMTAGDTAVKNGLRSLKQKHFEVAEAQFEEALQLPLKEHSKEEVLCLIGNVYKELGQQDKAILSYQRALEVNPNYVTAWVNQGIVYRTLKKNDKAEECYKNALQISPNDPHLLTSLGALEVHKKNYAEAVAYLKKSIRMDPKLNISYGNLAYTYAEMGDEKNANTFLQLAIHHGYDNVSALQTKINRMQSKQ